MQQNENKENFYHLKNALDILIFSSNVSMLRKEVSDLIQQTNSGVTNVQNVYSYLNTIKDNFKKIL